MDEVIKLNVGGDKFTTSKQTLRSIPETFFTSLLSGRIPLLRDGDGSVRLKGLWSFRLGHSFKVSSS
jgi:hypothetical protein